MKPEHDVERYYDRNTRRFLRFGGGRAAHAIHRLLWGPGVDSAEDAAGYINLMLERALAKDTAEHEAMLLDFGCGVGGTVLHLAAAFPRATVHGVTISEAQVEIANSAARESKLGDRAQFHRADFESLQLAMRVDAIVAVESFTHSRSPDAFFRAVSRHLKPGGQLIVVDDFCVRSVGELSAAEKNLSSKFRQGWRVPAFCTLRECISVAERHDLVIDSERNLTPLIRLHRPRDRLIGAVAPIASALGLAGIPFFGNLIGGNALHAGLASGLFEYRWLSFRLAHHRDPD